MYNETEREILIYFGQNIRNLRSKHGISQEDLAYRTDLDRTYISSLERGKRNPSLLTMLKLAKALNTDVETLFNRTNNE